MPNMSSFKNIEEHREWYREYRIKNKQRLLKYHKEYIANYRLKNGYKKDNARKLLSKAVKSGKIIKIPCVKCGNTKSEGHHKDYNYPLKVIWLCSICHKQKHCKK